MNTTTEQPLSEMKWLWIRTRLYPRRIDYSSIFRKESVLLRNVNGIKVYWFPGFRFIKILTGTDRVTKYGIIPTIHTYASKRAAKAFRNIANSQSATLDMKP